MDDLKNHLILTHALRSIGVMHPVHEGCSWPVFEDDYMKFMGGPHFDRVACDQFELWLCRLGFGYERHRDRAIRKIEFEAIELINRLWGPDDLEGRTVRKIDLTAPVLYPSFDYATFVGGTKVQRSEQLRSLEAWADRHGYGYTVRENQAEIEMTAQVLNHAATDWLGHPPRQAWSAPQVAA